MKVRPKFHLLYETVKQCSLTIEMQELTKIYGRLLNQIDFIENA